VSSKPTRVLLVEDNPGDARLIREMLAEAGTQDFTIEWVTRLADGLELLGGNHIDLVLLDLGLPDSKGLDTFIKVHERAPQVPFVVLTGLADETLALTTVRKGAQDYLFKGETSPQLLLRTIRYATERKQAELALVAERKKLYALLNSLPAFVHLKGADFTIKFANRRFTEFFGEPGHKHCYEVLRGRSEPCEDCRAVEVLKTKTSQKFEWHDLLHDRIFEVYDYPFCTDDELLVLTLGVDITERKQAEEGIRDREQQLTTIYENAPLIIMLVDAERRVCKANKMAAEFAGAAASDLIGRRGGEALRCLHTLDDPEGCGFGPHCQTCTVRHTVIDTFTTGRNHHQVEASLPFNIAGQPRVVTFLLSTARLDVQGQLQVLVTIQDISKRKQAEEALRQSEENLRYLASKLLNAQERERVRIAQELHDDLGQSLLLLKLQLSGTTRGLPPDLVKTREEYLNSIDSVQDIIDSVRCLSQDLIPPTLGEIGLKAVLKDLIDEFCRHHDLACSLDIDEIKGLFSPNTELIIYRILQESLTNIGKYSQATQVSVSIKRKAGQVRFSVEDNGKGFEVNQILARRGRERGLGLSSMEERARMLGGSFQLWSKPDVGTKIQIIVPFRQ
jgi:signal transduction histidine kinase/DNA-binding response OmpR family regulator